MINLEKVDGKVLLALTTVHGILYTLLTFLFPCAIIFVKYDLYREADAGKKLTGIGLIVLLAFLFIGLGALKKQIEKIPIDAQTWKSKCKAILKLIYSILLPVIILLVVHFIKDNMVLATKVIELCVYSVTAGAVENCLLGSAVERENTIRDNSSRAKEANKRDLKV